MGPLETTWRDWDTSRDRLRREQCGGGHGRVGGQSGGCGPIGMQCGGGHGRVGGQSGGCGPLPFSRQKNKIIVVTSLI